MEIDAVSKITMHLAGCCFMITPHSLVEYWPDTAKAASSGTG